MQELSGKPNVVVKPPLLYLISITTGLILHWLRPIPLLPAPFGTIVGLGLIAAAITLALWAQREFESQDTAVNPDFPPSALVTTGPYRYSRNPMYISLTALQIGIGLAVGSSWLLITLIPTLLLMVYGVIKREEVFLATRFGQPYRDYQASVRRWI